MQVFDFTMKYRDLAMERCGGRCEYPDCISVGTEAHHALVNDSKCNRGQYPILLDSLFNIRILCHSCHELHRNYWIVSEHHAKCMEKYLRELKEGK